MPNDQVRLRPQCVKDTRQLNGNVPRPHHDDRLGLFLDIKESIRVDTVLCARDVIVGRNSGPATDGDIEDFGFDLVGLGTIPAGDLDFVGREELGPALVVVDLVVDEVLLTAGSAMCSEAIVASLSEVGIRDRTRSLEPKPRGRASPRFE